MREAIEEIQMKRSVGFALMLVLFAVPAFAGNKTPTVDIPINVQVGSTQIPAGLYEVTWTGSGPSVQATLIQNNKTVVTFSAKLVEGKNNPGVETDTRSGAAILDAINTSKFSLTLEDEPQSGQ
jgi:hypothetical protein